MKATFLTTFLLLVSLLNAGAQSASTDTATINLKEIIVSANQPATRLEGTTLVSTITGSHLQNIGTALDVLAQLPLIKVADRDVSIIGKGTPEVYIDGQPMRDSDQLEQLQSGNIKKIELLLAPGAEYSSSTKAVVRITTRHTFLQGLSLTDRARIQKRRQWSAYDMLDINYRSGVFDIFATGTIARNNDRIKGTTVNRLTYLDRLTTIGSSQDKESPATVGTLKAGVNYADAARSAGAYYRYNPEHGDFSNNGSEWFDDDTPIARTINRTIRSHSHLVSAYYDDTFHEKYLLHFDGLYRTSHSSNATSTIYPAGESSDVNSSDKKTSSLAAAKLYLKMPLWKGRFTIGAQAYHTRSKLDYRMHNTEVGSYIPSSVTESRQTSTAAFASWNRNFGKLDISAGLRYEFADYTFCTDGVRDNNVSRTDHLLTPDISLGWNFNNRAQVSLSYKSATIRPPYAQLTGSLSYVGSHEIEGGNPSLHDERLHDVQLFGMYHDFMFQADFTRSIDTYAFIKRLYPAPSLQLMMRPENIDVSALDLYLTWTRNIRAWTPSITAGMHKQWLELDHARYGRPIFSYYFDNTIALPHSILLTINAYGSSAGYIHTNRFGATAFSMDASIGKSFLNKALDIKLEATDIFNTANNDWSMYTYGISVDKRQTYDRRGIALSLTYRLRPHQSKYKGGTAADDELKRL